MKRPNLPALFVVTGLLLTATIPPATAAPLRAPAAGPTADRSPGEVSSVGDTWLPDRRKPGKAGEEIESFSMSCEIGEGTFANGNSIIKLVNTDSKPIPANAIVEVTFPDGTTQKFKTASEIKPGGSVGIMGPVGATPETFPCSASASRQVPVTNPGSPVGTSAPKGLPVLPPELSCSFEVVGGKVVVSWTNVGNATVLAGAMITGKNAAGIGVSWFIDEPIKPGETISTTLDIDPKFFNEACVATISY